MTENKLERKPRFINKKIKTKKEKKRKETNQMLQFRSKLLRFQQLRLLVREPRVLVRGRALKRTESEHVTQSNSHSQTDIQ